MCEALWTGLVSVLPAQHLKRYLAVATDGTRLEVTFTGCISTGLKCILRSPEERREVAVSSYRVGGTRSFSFI